jgi:STE24 endopeptidase
MLLWRTTVPSSLHLPRIDESAAFGGNLVNHARRFERYLDWDWVLGTVAVLASYVVMVRRGRTLAARLGLRPVNAGIVLGLLTLTVAWAAALPFDVAANWWERRHGISHQGYASQLAGDWGTLLGTSATAFVVLAIVLTLARRFGRRWWLATAPTLAAILLAFQFVSPYVAALGTHPVRSPVLRADIRTLERREHAGQPTVRVDDVSGTTSEANAFSIGIGPTAHVLIWNTLLDGRFSPDQVRFVVGHELGHLARNHILRGVAWFALLLLPILAITAFVADVRRPAAVPLALLVIALLQLAVLPLRNAISRRYEAEADWIGLTGTGDATAARDLFVGFVKTSLQDPSPPGWVHVLLDDHPTPLQRVEMTRAWSSRNR